MTGGEKTAMMPDKPKLVEIRERLFADGYTDMRETQHGIVCLGRFIFTKAIIVGADWSGYSYRYCFPGLLESKTALEDWRKAGYQGEPQGYIVRKGLGEDKPGSAHPDWLPEQNENQERA